MNVQTNKIWFDQKPLGLLYNEGVEVVNRVNKA